MEAVFSVDFQTDFHWKGTSPISILKHFIGFWLIFFRKRKGERGKKAKKNRDDRI
ncbi:hypothetical protein B4135_1041 [Caldibacillus debilis]|uniref:Uncharacterized protein n=1 Tax=Caldibacillus debilis TaxID=301148 RepID=A0A150MF39_9BACI|nr:hypothetical protein B4135_1041 [Caldibacillus debilis]